MSDRGTAPLSAGERPRVESLAIELVAYCNQKCDYCYNEWREDGGGSLIGGADQKVAEPTSSAAPNGGSRHASGRPSQVERVRRILAAWNLDHVTLTGGEPFASRELFPVLELLKQGGVGIQIISNGGLITDQLAARLRPFKLRFVQVTLNGPSAELHEAHVGEGHFEPTLRGVRALIGAGIPVVGCVVVTRKNARSLAQILELWYELGVRQIALSRFSPAGYAARFAAELLPSRGDLTAAFQQAEAFVRARAPERMHVSCTMPVPPCAVEVELFPHIRFGTCPIGTGAQEFALGPDGKLRNCTLHRAALGGVQDILDPDVDLARLVRSPEIQAYRQALPEFCEGCIHAATCAGGCGAAAEWVLGHARQYPDPLVWQHVDDAFGATLAEARSQKRHLELIR